MKAAVSALWERQQQAGGNTCTRTSARTPTPTEGSSDEQHTSTSLATSPKGSGAKTDDADRQPIPDQSGETHRAVRTRDSFGGFDTDATLRQLPRSYSSSRREHLHARNSENTLAPSEGSSGEQHTSTPLAYPEGQGLKRASRVGHRTQTRPGNAPRRTRTERLWWFRHGHNAATTPWERQQRQTRTPVCAQQ